MNAAWLTGRLVKKPELRQTTEGKNYVQFTLAVNRKSTTGKPSQKADFISCVLSGKAAEYLCKWGDKGTKISLEGEIRTRNYDKDGQRRYVTEVHSKFFEFGEKHG